MRGIYCSRQNRRHRCGCHFGWNLSRFCPGPSRNTVMGRLWYREALPLLPHQLNLPRTWGGKSSCPFSRLGEGSDATSQFSGKRKKSAWKAWKPYLAATAGFTSASQDGFVPLEFTFRLIERFTCIMYDSTISYDKVNDLRQDIFPTRVKIMEKLTSTETALLQQENRCLYQASIWKNSLKPIIAAPNPEGFGWTREDTA